MCQKSSRRGGALQISIVAGDRVQVNQATGGIAGDLGTYRLVPCEIDSVIAGDAAVRFLNAGVQKPIAGACNSE